METITTHGEYGERHQGATSAQIIMLDGRAFVVTYTFERWSDILGTLEVIDIHELADEFGMGSIARTSVTDVWMRRRVRETFGETISAAVRAAMGTV